MVNDSLRRLSGRWGTVALTYGVLLVLAVTLFPYDFVFEEEFSTIGDRFRLLEVGKLADFLLNVLLFLPLGFGLTCLAEKKKLARQTGLFVVLASGFFLSSSVEVLQVFLPSRFVSLVDVVANTAGTFLGFLVFRFWEPQILNCASTLLGSINKFITIKVVTASFIGYTALTLVVSIPLQQATSLTNWDDTFPLLLGNERTGNRPWRGRVYQLQIANRAISEEEVAQAFFERGTFASIEGPLLGSYQLTQGRSYNDQTGHLPDLVWKGQPPDSRDNKNAFLGKVRWLQTMSPASALTRELRRTSQFTLSTTVATADTEQNGPARIISLSGDPYHRNFTLGQEKNHLVFRLRTPLTGENGLEPPLIVPNIFTSRNPRHLAVTYDGSSLRLYVDGLRHSHSLNLTPGATLFSNLFPIDARDMAGYKTLYYGFIFVPLGFLLALIVRLLNGRVIIQLLIVAVGVLLPPFVLESVLASVSGRLPDVGNMLFNWTLTIGGLLLLSTERISIA